MRRRRADAVPRPGRAPIAGASKAASWVTQPAHGMKALGGASWVTKPTPPARHRYPFLLVDRVVEVEYGKYAVGYKNVTINDNFFTGHFPDRPIMPGELRAELAPLVQPARRHGAALQRGGRLLLRRCAWTHVLRMGPPCAPHHMHRHAPAAPLPRLPLASRRHRFQIC